jgi:hypothetical protein
MPISLIGGSLPVNTERGGGIQLKITRLGVGLILVIVIAVALAGCTTTQTTTQTGSVGQGTPAQGTAAPAGGSAPQAGSVVSGTSIFGSAQPYNWIEYKTSMNAGGTQMTTYMKMEKSGKCTIRTEGEGLPGGSMTMDCSSKGGQTQGEQGGQTQSNPNDIKSDVQFTFVGIEPVTVPAGTYATASKYTVTSQGHTMTYWTAPGVPGFVKYQINTENGPITTELNGWG